MTSPFSDSNSEMYLLTSLEIGQHLAGEAVWYRGRCNWLGADLEGLDRADKRPSIAYRTLGPELYSGTSGVALFLAELHAATGEPSARRTALGAIRHALSRADSSSSANRLGFHTGWTGIAFVAARVGRLLGEEQLLHSAARLMGRSVCENQDVRSFDLLSGKAGAIAALIVLRNVLDDVSLLDFAVRMGNELLQTAEVTDHGYSWRSPEFPNDRNLTGFSHGTAGVGYALLELSQATGESKYQRAAKLAFEYERFWFDADAGNWPDFRGEPMKAKRGKQPLSFATYWCHGAPGISLSRLRAYELLNDEKSKGEAIDGIGATRRMIETGLHSGRGNFSLCHGLTGNSEVLLYGCKVLGQEGAEYSTPALNVASLGIESYTKPGALWPCGIGAGETPSLMLGLAGIGYFYLRLHDSTVPSILLLRPEEFLD